MPCQFPVTKQQSFAFTDLVLGNSHLYTVQKQVLYYSAGASPASRPPNRHVIGNIKLGSDNFGIHDAASPTFDHQTC